MVPFVPVGEALMFELPKMQRRIGSGDLEDRFEGVLDWYYAALRRVHCRDAGRSLQSRWSHPVCAGSAVVSGYDQKGSSDLA